MPYIHHQYWPLSPVVAAGTAIASAASYAWPLAAGHLHGVQVQIPSGHNGLTGVRILYQGQQVIPWSNSAWLVGSGDTFAFSWEAEVMASGLTVQAYNTDLVNHQFFLRADLTPALGGGPAAYSPGLLEAPPSPGLTGLIASLHG